MRHDTRRPTRTAAGSTRPRTARNRNQTALVLLVEDDPDTREMLAVFLTYSGFAVEHAMNGAGALASVARRVPDIIVSDIAMPVMDGIWLCRAIKRDERTAHVPVIAATCHSSAPVIEQARAAGFDAIVVKPYRLEELVAEIRAAIARARKVGLRGNDAPSD